MRLLLFSLFTMALLVGSFFLDNQKSLRQHLADQQFITLNNLALEVEMLVDYEADEEANTWAQIQLWWSVGVSAELHQKATSLFPSVQYFVFSYHNTLKEHPFPVNIPDVNPRIEDYQIPSIMKSPSCVPAPPCLEEQSGRATNC
ncbi:hypothetical protein [Persicobacter psychrovividus]|uniref:Uncharacterized protein n=1 Tax=Persicobacter psychrovividus TaxID=387638 RepID=A0ABM7VI26_9BACT|nr:hypothetical protein PEPS_28970 [Persicobacter psychrovividus]